MTLIRHEVLKIRSSTWKWVVLNAVAKTIQRYDHLRYGMIFSEKTTLLNFQIVKTKQV